MWTGPVALADEDSVARMRVRLGEAYQPKKCQRCEYEQHDLGGVKFTPWGKEFLCEYCVQEDIENIPITEVAEMLGALWEV